MKLINRMTSYFRSVKDQQTQTQKISIYKSSIPSIKNTEMTINTLSSNFNKNEIAHFWNTLYIADIKPSLTFILLYKSSII
jgi:hypothetical protein